MQTMVLERELQALDNSAEKLLVACHEGEMLYRRWNGPDDAETVLLVHGGSGSWLHWFRNISFLRRHCHVVTVDLPGLGDSAALAEGYTATDAVDVFSSGTLDIMQGKSFHIVAFSWGCAVSSQAALYLGNQLRSLLLTGPASLGDIPRRGTMKPLIRRTPDMSALEVREAHRENLARLMIYDRSRIDDLAVLIQILNTQKARFNSPQFARSKLVLEGVARTRVPLKVVYGQYDAPGLPDIVAKKDLFEAVSDNVEFEIIADAGHWLQYEQAGIFNEMTLQWLTKNSGRS
ncbi:MAG: alpha/beta hydrolase [Gammaproteobacteria bacterium]|jgi:pimeloyl-ACP methyl ester carboxylesterase|nr:alpha/beta hydrolase [Gammaproteobacteria bacterium]MBT5203396.1 alpha/beta hydrolase [Gammaproteobacteria bacterium]MBT5601524.1 alpha/beta hydrolase [Gammaproteobacteria bacterium]